MSEEGLNNQRMNETGDAAGNASENATQDAREAEKEKREEYIKRGRLTGAIRLVAGLYFISSLFSGIIVPLRNGTLDMPAYAIVIISIFGILGIVLIIDGIKKLLKYGK